MGFFVVSVFWNLRGGSAEIVACLDGDATAGRLAGTVRVESFKLVLPGATALIDAGTGDTKGFGGGRSGECEYIQFARVQF